MQRSVHRPQLNTSVISALLYHFFRFHSHQKINPLPALTHWCFCMGIYIYTWVFIQLMIVPAVPSHYQKPSWCEGPLISLIKPPHLLSSCVCMCVCTCVMAHYCNSFRCCIFNNIQIVWSIKWCEMHIIKSKTLYKYKTIKSKKKPIFKAFVFLQSHESGWLSSVFFCLPFLHLVLD